MGAYCASRPLSIVPMNLKFDVRVIRKGQEVTGWFPMAKGVANLYRYAEVSLAANGRYLDALAAVDDPAKAQQCLNNLGLRIRHNGRSYRGFNPIAKLDLRLFLSVLRGEYSIMGFRNKDIRHQFFSTHQRSQITSTPELPGFSFTKASSCS